MKRLDFCAIEFIIKMGRDGADAHFRTETSLFGMSAIKMAHRIKTNQDMTEGPLLGKMIKFALPLMATGLLQVLYNASDMIVVGNFSPSGANAMGAVGACGSLINLIVNLFLGLSVGAGIVVAQNVGAKRFNDVKDIIHTSFAASIILGVILAIFGFFMSKPLLLLMGMNEIHLPEAVPYMKAYFVGMPAMLLYNFLAAALRSSGDTKRPIIFLSIAGLINVGMNIFFVLAFGMGAVGVGIATTISQYASAIMIVVYMMRTEGICKLNLKDVKIHKKKLMLIIQNGLPSGVQSFVFSISNVLIQSTVNSYAPVVVNGNAAGSNIEGFIYVAMNAMYQTSMTFAGQNVGAGKIERIKRITVLSIILVSIIGLVLGITAFLFHEPLLSIYVPGDDSEAIATREAGMLRMEIICTLYFLCGVMDVLGGVLKGMGKSILPMATSILGSCVLRIIWIITVCNMLFPGQIVWLYIAYPVTWTITALGHSVCCVISYKALKRQRDALAAAEEKRLSAAAV